MEINPPMMKAPKSVRHYVIAIFSTVGLSKRPEALRSLVHQPYLHNGCLNADFSVSDGLIDQLTAMTLLKAIFAACS